MNVLEAIRLADRWVDAWNRRDVRALLAMYADTAEAQSPFVTLLSSVRDAALRGKAALEAHFRASWELGPRNRMMLEDVHLGEASVTLDVRGGCAPWMEMEFGLDEAGRIEWSKSRVMHDLPTPKAS